MRTRTLFTLMSSALTLCFAVSGWQLYQTHQLREELSSLRESLEAETIVSANPLPGSSAPVQTPGSSDPFANFFSSDPFSGFDQMRQRMEQMFGAGGSLFDFPGAGFASAAQPEIEMSEKPDAYVVTIELPEGSSDVELSTEVDNGQLSIEGKLTVRQDNSQQGRSITSMQTQQFSRRLPLPKDVDPLGIRNETQGNQVVVTLPKTTG